MGGLRPRSGSAGARPHLDLKGREVLGTQRPAFMEVTPALQLGSCQHGCHGGDAGHMHMLSALLCMEATSFSHMETSGSCVFVKWDKHDLFLFTDKCSPGQFCVAELLSVA